ncbi:MAG: P1 family peptidase [Clostridia bacterium]
MLKDFKVGHYTNEEKGTGATVIIAEEGAIAGVCVRGAAPATRETDLLQDGKTVQKINAVVLSGGSAFGLEAASGVMQALYDDGIGYNAGKYRVPIVCGASIYDLEYKEFAYPDKSAGYLAAKAAYTGNFEKGNIGGGTGATISKIAGMGAAVKGGLGVQTYSQNNIEIAVFSVVNALGDIVKDGKIIAGACDQNGKYLDALSVFTAGGLFLQNQNTTITCIITNAKLTKEEANMLASLAHNGYALSLSPAHTPYDGDAIFIMSSGKVDAPFPLLAGVIPALTAKAIQSVAEESYPISTQSNKLLMLAYKKLFKRK